MINQLTNLQTTVLRVFYFVFIRFKLVKTEQCAVFALTKHPYFSAAILFSVLDRYELIAV